MFPTFTKIDPIVKLSKSQIDFEVTKWAISEINGTSPWNESMPLFCLKIWAFPGFKLHLKKLGKQNWRKNGNYQWTLKAAGKIVLILRELAKISKNIGNSHDFFTLQAKKDFFLGGGGGEFPQQKMS